MFTSIFSPAESRVANLVLILPHGKEERSSSLAYDVVLSIQVKLANKDSWELEPNVKFFEELMIRASHNGKQRAR